jgi:hypothetical protein
LSPVAGTVSQVAPFKIPFSNEVNQSDTIRPPNVKSGIQSRGTGAPFDSPYVPIPESDIQIFVAKPKHGAVAGDKVSSM